MVTKNRKPVMSHEGYLYRFDWRNADDVKFWRCLQDGCQGRIKTDANDVFIEFRDICSLFFQGFRMCFFDNGLPSHASTGNHLQPFDINWAFTALSSFHWRDQTRTTMSQVDCSPASSRSSRRARPRHLHGNEMRGIALRVIETQPVVQLSVR